MRFAVSAVAALSGLFLLAVAFYGQPAVYIHQAREQWDQLIETQGDDLATNPDHDAIVEHMAQLQEQVVKLEAELAAKQEAASRPTIEQSPRDQSQSADSQPAIDQSSPVQRAISETPATKPVTSQPPGGPAMVQAPPQQQVPSPQQVVPRGPAPRPEAAHATPPHPEQPGRQIVATAAMPPPTVFIVPERREPAPPEAPPSQPAAPQPATTELPPAKPASAEAPLPKPAPAKAEQEKPAAESLGPPKPEVTSDAMPKADGPKPAPQKSAASKAIPAPPPLAPAPPARQNDDTQAVLARLRQQAPTFPPLPPPNTLPAVAPRPLPSPPNPGLAAARDALASGRIEDARRLLQQTQLQLVFRPVGAAGDDPPWIEKGAADVGHALDALSANDVPLSRRYVDVAVADLSGSGVAPPIQVPPLRTTGYAPAYPPH